MRLPVASASRRACGAERRAGPPRLGRRWVLASLAAPALQGCASPLPELSRPGTAADAQELLLRSAAAHGLAAFSAIDDLSVSYAGEWPALIGRLQPALVDAGFRGGSEERLLLRERVVAQAHTGPNGRKQVVRRAGEGAQGDVRVWFNGEEARDAERRAAAALVADGYSLFLLAPMLLARHWLAERSPALELAGVERLTVDGRRHECDVLRVRIAPGLGFSETDRLALFIDREERLMRRVRFTLNGLDSTRGAVAEVDASRHAALGGVRWPTRFHERLLRPFPLPVHDWRLTGLDVKRGLDASEVGGAAFSGKAVRPAAALP